ncbi:MAG TPA: hypothetical protein VJV03_09385 [Pyrinomonadaceae bacterium]|nr:hypothetical protein [Pyrinomonadaceae bacterium]
MNKRLRGSRRGLTKKVTSINFYVDQATQIQAIMEATGETKEAPLVRRLVDEALAARRRKSVQSGEPEPPPPTQDISETLQTLQTLMLRMIGQGERIFQMQSVSLELHQEAIVEARSGKMNVWEFLVAPGLSVKGKSTDEIAQLFDGQNEDAKDYAYGLAEEIKKELDADDSDSTSNPGDDDVRQASFAYETEESEEPT